MKPKFYVCRKGDNLTLFISESEPYKNFRSETEYEWCCDPTSEFVEIDLDNDFKLNATEEESPMELDFIAVK